MGIILRIAKSHSGGKGILWQVDIPALNHPANSADAEERLDQEDAAKVA